MKRKVLKDWVVIVLGFVNILAVMFIASDWENMLTFHLVHIIALAIFIFNATIITKYGKKDLFE